MKREAREWLRRGSIDEATNTLFWFVIVIMGFLWGVVCFGNRGSEEITTGMTVFYFVGITFFFVSGRQILSTTWTVVDAVPAQEPIGSVPVCSDQE